jgi:hypothetical protein
VQRIGPGAHGGDVLARHVWIADFLGDGHDFSSGMHRVTALRGAQHAITPERNVSISLSIRNASHQRFKILSSVGLKSALQKGGQPCFSIWSATILDGRRRFGLTRSRVTGGGG